MVKANGEDFKRLQDFAKYVKHNADKEITVMDGDPLDKRKAAAVVKNFFLYERVHGECKSNKDFRDAVEFCWRLG